jgi:hypothetical protein
LGEKIREEAGREIPNDVYVQGLEVDEGMFLPSVSVQMAEEASLIMPPPPP